MSLWPHQSQAVGDVLAVLAGGCRRVCLTSPTGGGKSRIASELIREFIASGLRVVVYTNRRMLVEQLSRVFDAAGLEHGVRAAGHQDQRHLPLQISSIQTEGARVLRRETGAWELHAADRVFVDEAHLFTGETAREVFARHLAAGASIVGMTATPIGLRDLYDALVVAGVPSELRRCGALVPCHHYAPDEPDLSKIGRTKLGEDLTEPQQVKAMMTSSILGRVIDWYRRLNDRGRPTLLFAPGVGESLWFAEQLSLNGVRAAHIDGEDVWCDGVTVPASPAARQEVMDGSRAGEIKVVCNRFVLREGVDMPWIEHGIIATVFGSLQTYLQSLGRLLRASPGTGKQIATVQDHGGNWWRHGSANADREWDLCLTPAMVTGTREDRLRDKAEKEPCRCPQCGMVLLARLVCPCGFTLDARKKSRPVVMHDGELRDVEGDVFRPRKVKFEPDTGDLWRKTYYGARHGDKTFKAAEAWFFQQHGYYPPRDLPLMPQDPRDWYRQVKDVPRDNLYGSDK